MTQMSEVRSMYGVNLEDSVVEIGEQEWSLGEKRQDYREWWRDVSLEGGRRLQWVEEEGLGMFPVTILSLWLPTEATSVHTRKCGLAITDYNFTSDTTLCVGHWRG
jgi:hypothetical protein